MTISINNTVYTLSKRRAGAVLELAKVQNNSANDPTAQIIIMAQTIADSLASTGLSTPFWKRRKYNRFMRGVEGAQYILKYVDIPSIAAAYTAVNELEGLKKKIILPMEDDLSVS